MAAANYLGKQPNGLDSPLGRQKLHCQFPKNSFTRFPLTAEQIDQHIDQFIQNIDEEAVGRLASRHNGQKSWKIVGRENGSFKVCYFVQFDDGVLCVVRITLTPVVENP